MAEKTGLAIAVFEALKGSGGSVDDVQVNGVSVVSGGVANVPVATSDNVGVVKIDTRYGLGMRSSPNQDVIMVRFASEDACKNGTNTGMSISPYVQHASTFYGFAKSAGDTTQSASSNAVGTYTDTAIDKILAMLGIDALIGKHEGATASEAKVAGDVFIYEGKLYEATDSIGSGEAIVPGTNCTQTTLINLIKGA